MPKSESKKQLRKMAARRPRFEELESRSLLAGDIDISISDATATEGSSAMKILDRFVESNSGGLRRPRTPLFGPDGNGDGLQDLYVVSADTNEILRYDGETGVFLDTFVAARSGGLLNPGDIAFGPDGNLYVSSLGFSTNTPVIPGAGKVLRFEGTTGAYLNTIMTGLSNPLGVTVDSDGTVYAASQDTDEIYRSRGGITSVFIAAGSGGLNQPRNAIIGPDVTGDGVGDLYVSSQSYDGVLRYNGRTGAFIDKFASTGLALGPAWIEFAPDNTLVATALTTPTCCNISFLRFDGSTGEELDQLDTTTLGWAFKFGPDGLIYGVFLTGDGLQSYVDRIGPSSMLAFTVSLSSPSDSPVTVDYATANGSATAGSDFTAASGTLTFAPGQTSRTILVQALDDTLVETNENFVVNLTGAIGGVIVDGTGTGTIIDDDRRTFDLNSDTVVNRGDLAILIGNYGLTGTAFAHGDVTGNGRISVADAIALRNNFTPSPSPTASAVVSRVADARAIDQAVARLEDVRSRLAAREDAPRAQARVRQIVRDRVADARSHASEAIDSVLTSLRARRSAMHG